MATILIVDCNKPSIVMTSEIVKDKIPGTTILIAGSGAECMKLITQGTIDLAIIDFDLPDTDGVTLTKAIRPLFAKPIILTAFPEEVVEAAVLHELFAYNDVSNWIKKPIKFDDLGSKLEAFLVEKKRILKRFETNIAGVLSAKSKSASAKVKGNVINLSLGGALIKTPDASTFKKGETFVLDFAASKVEKEKSKKKEPVRTPTIKVTGRVAWTNKIKKQVAIEFEGINDQHRDIIEEILRQAKEVAT